MPTPKTTVKWLTPDQVSELTGMSLEKLKKDRCQKRGIPYIKVGTADQSPVFYTEADVAAWQAQWPRIETEDSLEKAS